jgi:hypothetical protein
MNHNTLRRLRIFLASPGDCVDDREKAKAVIQDLDRALARPIGLLLEPNTWEDVVGDMGRPEQIILDQIQLGKMDLFVGLMWRRFGMPTGENYDSGTEEEFFQAYSTWRSKGQPRILFYFCTSPFYPRTRDERDQFDRVMNFKNKLAKIGMFKEYQGEGFESKFRQDMTRLLTNWSEPVRLPGSTTKVIQGECWDIWRDAYSPERNGSERVEAYLYKQANYEVKFMTISGRSIFCSNVEEAVLSHNPDVFKLRLLLFDWNSPCFAEKMQDERRRTDIEIGMAKERAKDVAKQFLTLAEKTGIDLQVRLYQEYPVWRIMVLDEKIAYAGYYPNNKRGYEGPMLSFKKGDPRGLFHPINQYFDKLWEVSPPLALEALK